MALLRATLLAQLSASVASQEEHNEFVGLMTKASDDCVADNQCGRNDTPCCSGGDHTTLKCGWDKCEDMCEKIVGKMIELLPGSEAGCIAVIGEGDALCEVILLGPENPLADASAAVVTIGCPIIAGFLIDQIPDAATICGQTGVCGGNNGQRCGCLEDGRCASDNGSCCSGKSHFTMACPGMHRCGDKNPTPPSLKTITPASSTNLCLDLPGGDTTPGNALWLWECNGGQTQQWVFDNWQIRYGADDSKCVDAGDMSAGNQLFLWNCNDEPQQTWGYDSDAQRVYLANTATCADWYDGDQDNGQPFHVWDCNGLANQQWGIWDVGSVDLSSAMVAV